MKKLMIMAAIVCAAIMSQAAAIEWELYSSSDVPGIEGGTYSGMATISCAALDFSHTFEVVDGYFDEWPTIDCALYTEYTFTMTASTPTHTYISIAKGAADDSVGGVADFGAGTWTAVPEPTSGLLLLLGVAGLALRRRRA